MQYNFNIKISYLYVTLIYAIRKVIYLKYARLNCRGGTNCHKDTRMWKEQATNKDMNAQLLNLKITFVALWNF